MYLRNRLLNISLFVSSFVPLYLLVAINIIIEIINDNLHFNITNTTLLALMIILSIVGIVGVYYLIKYEDKKTRQIKILSCKNTTDQHFLGYFSLFVLFALTFDLSKVSMSIIFVIILILIGIVYVRNRLFGINPLLNIIGYSCYDVEFLDESANEQKMQMFFKGKLNIGKYKVSYKSNGICFIVQEIKK